MRKARIQTPLGVIPRLRVSHVLILNLGYVLGIFIASIVLVVKGMIGIAVGMGIIGFALQIVFGFTSEVAFIEVEE